MFKRLFSFYGSASRQEYWFVTFTPLLVGLGGVLAFAGIGVVSSENMLDEFSSDKLAKSATQLFGSTLMIVIALTWISLQLASLWWQLTVFARRSRSAGVSANWTWVYVLMYLLSPFLIPAFIAILMWIVWGILPPRNASPNTITNGNSHNRIEPKI